MVDIHTHILPGLDDGSQSMDDSLMMAELSLESGVDTVVATPHCNQIGRFENFVSPELDERLEQFRRALQRERLPLRVVRGAEVFASWDMMDQIEAGRIDTLNHTRRVLVEFPFGEEPDIIHEQLHMLLRHGHTPVIAHPERYYCVQDDPNFLYDWLQQGCLAQMNKGSVFGRFGRHAAVAAEAMLEYRLIQFVASDAHSPYRRTTFMGDIREFLTDRLSEEAAHELLTENPQRLLDGRPVPKTPRRPETRRRWY